MAGEDEALVEDGGAQRGAVIEHEAGEAMGLVGGEGELAAGDAGELLVEDGGAGRGICGEG